MISLTCTSCKKVLQIDDAFAGGVCRCQYCGTIQTVPAALKQQARAGAPAQGTGARTLYQRMPHGRRAAAAAAAQGRSGAGGEDADAPRNRAAVPGQPGRAAGLSPKILGLIGGGIVVLALLGWLLFR